MPIPSALEALLAVAGPPLDPAPAPVRDGATAQLRARRNGWIAYFSALHVFSAAEADAVAGTLRLAFGERAAGHEAFAHDLFGGLLTVHAEGVCAFDPETAEHEVLAPDLESWAGLVAADPETQVGSAFAFAWQERHGALESGERLVPLVPFVLGGEYDDANLEPRGALQALRERGALARALAGVPDGQEVEWPLPGTREGAER